jgi:hypothetical protein
MKMKLTWLVFAAALSLASAPGASAAKVTHTHVKDGYKLTCVINDGVKYCGNWNVASGG